MGHLTQYGPFYPDSGWSNGICTLLNLDFHVQVRRAMIGVANTMARVSRAAPVILLILVFLSASVACAAMAPVSAPPHPCCPNPGQSDSDHCAKMGCISTVQVLRPASIIDAIQLPVAALADQGTFETDILPESAVIHAFVVAPFELFLTNHQLLI